jgi:DNA recombination protein RmuC
MIEALCGALGLAVGALVAWFYRKSREAQAVGVEREGRLRLEVQLEEARRGLAEQKALLDDARAKLEDAFKAMAGDALRGNNAEFLRLAEQSMKGVLAQASGDLELRKKAVEELVRPIQDSLKQYQEKADALERERQQAYGGLSSLLQGLAVTQERLKLETANLVAALRQPNVRGRWGELTLRRVVELAGLSEHCDFTEQKTVEGEEGALRPDLVVHLPNRRDIVIDAKAVLAAYLEAQEAATDEARQAALGRHAAHLKERVRALSRKEYWKSIGDSAEFVVLFVPGEPFLAAAVQQDPGLVEEALKARIVIATPTTLVALLKAVHLGWQQERMNENAQEVAKLGASLFEGMAIWAGHLRRLGESIAGSVDHFNMAQSSLDRVLGKARKMKELGVESAKDLPEIKPVEKLLRVADPPKLD